MKRERIETLDSLIKNGAIAVNTETGVIIGKRGKPIGNRPSMRRYPQITVTQNGKVCTYMIHEVIAHVAGYDLEGMTVNHVDGDKGNNKLSNLEVVSQSENNRHAYDSGFRSKRLTKEKVREIKRMLYVGVSNTQIADQFDICISTVWKISKGILHKDVTI